jgi:uncharacterized protein (TIGR00251 family)
MEIKIKVIPGAKKNQLKEEAGTVKVYVSAPATDGRANKALIELLAEVYHVRKRQIQITRGLKSRVKTIKINEF